LVPHLDEDRVLTPDIMAIRHAIRSAFILDAAEHAAGELSI